MKRVAYVGIAAILLAACTAMTPEPRPVGACQEPEAAPDLAAVPTQDPEQYPWLLTFSLDQEPHLLGDRVWPMTDPRLAAAGVDPVPAEVNGRHVRLTLHFIDPPDRARVADALKVAGDTRVTCRWFDQFDLLLDLEELSLDKPVRIEGIPAKAEPGSPPKWVPHTMSIIRRDTPGVSVRRSDGFELRPRGSQQPHLLPAGETELIYTFSKEMDRAKVEARLRAETLALKPGYNPYSLEMQDKAAPAPPTLVWESGQRLRVKLDPAQGSHFRLPTADLVSIDGTPTIGGWLDLLLPTVPLATLTLDGSLQELPGGLPDIFRFEPYLLPQVAPDGSTVLLEEYLETGFAPEYRLWLYRPESGRQLTALEGTYYLGNTYFAGLLPAGKGVVAADSRRIYHYDLNGRRRIIWQSSSLIHGVAIAPQSGRLALFVSGEGDEIRLKLLDPTTRVLTDQGVVDSDESKPSHTEVSRHKRIRADWSPDETTLVWGGGTFLRRTDGKEEYIPATFLFRPGVDLTPGTLPGIQAADWSPDGKHLLAMSGYLAHIDGPGPQAVVTTAGGAEVMRLPGYPWYWAGANTLWQPPLLRESNGSYVPETPSFQWRTLDGTAGTGPAGWYPIGFKEGRLYVVRIRGMWD